MSTAGSLSGISVLVTRPTAQAEKLCTLIQAAGGNPVRFPVMEIEPLDVEIPEIGQYDWLIFISANAVRYFFRNATHPLPPEVKVAVIGQRTAEALAKKNIEAALVPPSPFSSEVLLAEDKLQSLKGQRILIVRGVGGREQLRDSLQLRGAHVDYCEVYRRVCPASDPSVLMADWQQGGVDVLTLASNESLDNLIGLLGDAGHALLTTTPLIAIGDRMVKRAKERGLLLASVKADNATDAAVFSALERWAETRATT